MKKGIISLVRLIVTSMAFLVGLFTTASVDLAGANGSIWQDITGSVNVTKSTPLYDVVRNVYVSSVTVNNPLLSPPINGRLRAVITSSSKTPLAPDGTSADGKPFYNLVTDPNAVLGAGQTTPPRAITFTATRGVLTYTVRIENEQKVVPGSPPVANAGPSRVVNKGALVQLNGAGSTDASGNPLTYNWSFVSRPAGSAAILNNPHVVNPTFIADVAGAFVIQLIVNNGTYDSTPSSVTITAQVSTPVANAGATITGRDCGQSLRRSWGVISGSPFFVSLW